MVKCCSNAVENIPTVGIHDSGGVFARIITAAEVGSWNKEQLHCVASAAGKPASVSANGAVWVPPQPTTVHTTKLAASPGLRW